MLSKRGVIVVDGEQTIQLDVRSLPYGLYGYSARIAYEEVSGTIVVGK